MPPTVEELVGRLLEGNRRALSRILTLIENDAPEGRRALALLYPRSGKAHTVGLTGSAGSGKSTLSGALARHLRASGKSLGIVAIDPTSPFSQGAILGDRIRMQDLTADPEIFLRSMATRGALGGLAPSTAGVVTALDAFGKDIVLVETVGAGQDEVDVAMMADTTVVVVTPGTGDDVQAMKAGIMEIADILVVNKRDLPNADLLARQLQSIVEQSPSAMDDSAWHTPILKTAGALDEGIDELAAAIQRHHDHIATSAVREEHRRAQARHQVLTLARQRLIDALVARHAGGRLDDLVDQVARREIDPHAAADALVGD
ncbi:MAG TPA: methylmalonyl Co-A mutase-associated GTPase MeaB [Dehalococcoidia bacterium]|nr:methylmalonyl Co-A mutase-associated GTPase MeaB [Dehalococcoidia bacterium]